MLNVKQSQVRGGKTCVDKYCTVFYSLFFIILAKQTNLRWVDGVKTNLAPSLNRNSSEYAFMSIILVLCLSVCLSICTSRRA